LTEPHLYGEAVAPPQNDYTKIREVVRTVFNGREPIVAPSEIQLADVPEPPATTAGQVTANRQAVAAAVGQ
jgi:hypothetical protein